jgi:hypothetical protein
MRIWKTVTLVYEYLKWPLVSEHKFLDLIGCECHNFYSDPQFPSPASKTALTETTPEF